MSSFQDLIQLVKASVVAQVVLLVIWVVLDFPLYRARFALDGFLTFGLIAGARTLVRAGYEYSARRARGLTKPANLRRVLVLGAGEAGMSFARRVLNDPALGFDLVGYLDDAYTKRFSKFYGVRVQGMISEVKEISQKLQVTDLLIAIPSLSKERLRQIVNLCLETRLPIKILPSLKEMVDVQADRLPLREVRVEDLLGREPIHLDKSKLNLQLQHSIVVVTGAGGSIGSELSRQVAGFNPQKLILFERYENNLFYIRKEILDKYPNLKVEAVVGDISDPESLDRLFERHAVDIVYHAAAHKHVPLMEDNPREAVKNNVMGTKLLAERAVQYGVKRFVMVSTDKAVNPVSVMGYSKRMAELVCQEYSGRGTVFVSVRFGNVLASNGSVVEIFRKQLSMGGPLTVTHPKAVRYFMTIPEAVELILQAGGEAESGQIFMLDMGEPVNIACLAEKMIQLADPAGIKNLRIEFTGLRPGERLSEELVSEGEDFVPSRISKMFVLRRRTAPAGVDRELAKLEGSLQLTSDEIAKQLKASVDMIDRPKVTLESSAEPLRVIHPA